MVAERGEFGAGNVRAGQIEFVLDAVERAVADQDQDEIVVGLGLPARPASRLSVRCARVASAPGERVDVRVSAGTFEQLVEVVGQRGEALLVIGLAAEPRDRDEIGMPRARAAREQQQASPAHEAQSRAHLHTIPHFRRSSHSENAQQQKQQKNDRHIPKFLGLAHGDARLRIGNFARQACDKFLRPPIAAAGLRGELFEQRRGSARCENSPPRRPCAGRSARRGQSPGRRAAAVTSVI